MLYCIEKEQISMQEEENVVRNGIRVSQGIMSNFDKLAINF